MNRLTSGEMVTMHSDDLGYVLLVEIPGDSDDFESGNVIFKQDNDKVVELGIKKGQLLVAKCTNEHGVTRVTKGARESIAFFARPKA